MSLIKVPTAYYNLQKNSDNSTLRNKSWHVTAKSINRAETAASH